MKLAVIGSRDFNDYNLLKSELDKIFITMIISGGAAGADDFSQRYAKENGLPILIFYPNWNKEGKSAGYKRNVKIIKACDEVIAFWDGKSKGTQHGINLAKDKKVKIINF